MSNETYIKLVEKILTNMRVQQSKVSLTSIMLAGDPGIGKTSFVRMLAKLLGLNIIVIEIPHIVEEHIINVPFIIFHARDDRKTSGTTEVRMSEDINDATHDYDIHLSDSNLISKIREKAELTNAEYLKKMYTESPTIISLFEELGGNPTTIPPEIVDIRNHFKTILFLDEFFRKVSPRIRNMLRTILNGNIGIDRIPRGTYVMYASNLNDEGIDEIPANTDLHTIQMKPPKGEDWRSYISNRHGVSVDPADNGKSYEPTEENPDGTPVVKQKKPRNRKP